MPGIFSVEYSTEMVNPEHKISFDIDSKIFNVKTMPCSHDHISYVFIVTLPSENNAYV